MQLSDLSSITGILTLIGVIYTGFSVRKNLHTTKFIDTITNERIKWMAQLREYLVEFLTIYESGSYDIINFINTLNENNGSEDRATLQTIFIENHSNIFSNNLEKMLNLSYKITLHLNPKGSKDKEIIKSVNEIINSYRQFVFSRNLTMLNSYFDLYREFAENKQVYLEKLIKNSQEYLKDEWERVKKETQKGYFVK